MWCAWTGAVLCVGAAAPAPTYAACLELPTPGIRAIDQLRDRSPEQAIAAADAELSKPQDTDPLLRAQLHLVIGFARGQEGRAADARTALDDARREVSLLPAGAARRRLEMLLAMGEFGFAKTNPELERGLSNIDALLTGWPAKTLERVCLLTSRGDFEAELDRPDLAVADHLEAYQAAHAAGWTDAAAMVALTLATTYRRGGLWTDAEQMASEALSYATDRQLTWFRGLALLTSGQIYSNEQRWDQAFAALDASRELLNSVNDTLTAALATLPMCDALINSGRLAEARSRCTGEFATFAGFARSDLVTDSLIYQARIDLLDKHYLAALNVLNSVLTTHLDDVPSRYRPRLYRERSDALSALGRDRAAVADLRRSMAAAESSALAERKRTAAVLRGKAQAQALESANLVLARENATQRQQIEGQRLARQQSVSLALAALMVSSLLAYLLYVGRRQRLAIERHAVELQLQAKVLETMSEGVLVLEDSGRISFVNAAMHKLLGGKLSEHVKLSGHVLGPSAEILQRWLSSVSADSVLRAESHLRRQDGRECLVSIACCRLVFPGRRLLVCVFRDISAQRRAERALADTTGRDVLQVASSLHEDLAQQLAGVSLQLGSLASGLNGADGSVHDTAKSAADLLFEAIRMARWLATLLSPMTAVSGVLGSALRGLADSATERFGIPVRYTETGGCVISGVTADQLFRVTLDALNYAADRSDQAELGLDLNSTVTQATLTVSWVCPGHEPDDEPAGMLDLEVIHHRARLLGGTCELCGGTTGRNSMLVTVPLQEENL